MVSYNNIPRRFPKMLQGTMIAGNFIKNSSLIGYEVRILQRKRRYGSFSEIPLILFYWPETYKLPPYSKEDLFFKAKDGNLQDIFEHTFTGILSPVILLPFLHKDLESKKKLFLSISPMYMKTVNEILPIWNEPYLYGWEKIRSSLLKMDLEMVEKFGSSRENLQTIRSLINGIVTFTSQVFAIKWILGMGGCRNDPNPENFDYPRTSVESRVNFYWATNLIEERNIGIICAETNFEVIPEWKNAVEKFEKETGSKIEKKILAPDVAEFNIENEDKLDVKEAYKRIVQPVEEEIINKEMRKRGWTKDYDKRDKIKFPPPNTYHSLDEILQVRLGSDFKTLPSEVIVNKASEIMSEVWFEYYGPVFLEIDLSEHSEEWTERDKESPEISWAQSDIRVKVYYLVDSIENTIHKFLKRMLIEKYGEDSWWSKGIPENIRVKCAEEKEKQKGKHHLYYYTYLLHLKDIIHYNKWDRDFAWPEDSKKERKENWLKWFDKLNSLRNEVDHIPKENLTHKDLEFLQKLRFWLERKRYKGTE